MTQHRYFNFGEPASAAIFKEMLSGITGKGVLHGGQLSVSTPDRVVIQPVWLMFESPRITQQGTKRANVLFYEDEPKQLIVPTTSSAANYTIVYHHTDADVFGSNAASLALESGLLENQNIDDGVVVGYVLYTGGGGALTDTMLIPAPQGRLQALASPADGFFQCPPFSSMLYAHTGAGMLPTLRDYDDPSFGPVYEITNSGPVPSIDTLRWSFIVGREPPQNLTLDYVAETGQIIVIDIQDTDGNVSSTSWTPAYPVLANMLTNDYTQDYVLQTVGGQELRRKRLRITNGTFTAGKRFRIQATIQTAAGKRTLVAGIGHSTYRQPFAG